MPAPAPRSQLHVASPLILFLLMLACGGGGEEPVSPSFRPAEAPARSFLLLTLDTVSPDHLEPYGAGDAETPALASLARDGAVLERAYAATPVTLPSHASLLTGLDPPQHGVRDNGIHHLREGVPTLAEHLREAGFATAAFVSAAVLEARYGLDRGFELYDDDLSAGGPRARLALAERPAEATVAAALEWLDSRLEEGRVDDPVGETRFFLWVHLFDPHAAYDPPSPWAERFEHRPYDGEIAYMDSQIARLLQHPAIASPTTLVMAVGDHGESLGAHGEATHAMLAYDATLWVPWILRGPGVEPGLRLGIAAGHVDLPPTALELLGLEGMGATPEGVSGERPGRSLAPLLAGGEGGPEPGGWDLYAETLVPLYTYGWAPLRTLRRGGWKYIEAPSPELYHVADDPLEQRNLVDSEPARAARLAGRLERRSGEGPGAPSPAAQPVDRETRERLRSLGYLGGGGSTPPPPGGAGGQRPDPKAMMAVHRAVERAQHHLYEGQPRQAVGELRAVLREDPTNRIALADLARALGEMGRVEDALEALRRALELAPEDPELYLLRAGLESARERPRQALEALDAALELDPRSVDVRVEKARVLVELGRTEGRGDLASEGLALLGEVLEEAPDHPRANILYARLAEAPAEEHAGAARRLARALEREPYRAEGWRLLGRLLERAGRPGQAMEAYRKGLAYLPRDAGLLARLGSSLAQGGAPEEAAEHLERALELSAEPGARVGDDVGAEIHEGLALVAMSEGEWPEGEKQARRALALDPERPSAWSHLAVALEEQGRTAEALAAYGEARRVDPGYWQAIFNRGLLLRKLGREEEAVRAFREVLLRRPDYAKAHYELGVLHGAAGRAEPARRHLRAALEAEPDHPRNEQVRRLLAALDGASGDSGR